MKKINWGIIGAGNAAASFVKALALQPEAGLYAAASRDKIRAESLGRMYGFTRIYAGDYAYNDLLADKNVHAVYIATAHINHSELSLKALKAGKAVLCEKPAAVNAAQFYPVAEYSAAHKVFYMEAMWMKFNPAVRRMLEVLRSGILGQLYGMQADFCIQVPYDIHHRLYNPLLAGGALLDTGIYPLSLAMLAAAASASAAAESPCAPPLQPAGRCCTEDVLEPSRIQSSWRKSPSGVDIWNAVLAEWNIYGSRFVARLSSGNDVEGRDFFNDALLWGARGKIRLRNFWRAEEIEYYDEKNNLVKKEQYPFKINGYEYEIEEMHRCIKEGLYESPLHSHTSTLTVMRMLDAVRAQWNFTYPCEKAAAHTDTAQSKPAYTLFSDPDTEAADNIILYSDGACSGNPGPGGWAAAVLYSGTLITTSGGEKATTNNRMELSGAIGALEKLFSIPEAEHKKIVFNIDSQYVKNGISSWIHTWKQNGWKTSDKKPVKNKDLWEKLDLYTRQFRIEWRWVKGHSGNEYNELCDELAVKERNKRC